MILIPSEEIKFPDLHLDTLGFTFTWKGHFLRGIYHESIELAKTFGSETAPKFVNGVLGSIADNL